MYHTNVTRLFRFHVDVNRLSACYNWLSERCLLCCDLYSILYFQVELEGVRRVSGSHSGGAAVEEVEETATTQEAAERAKRKRAWEASPIGRVDHKKAKVRCL